MGWVIVLIVGVLILIYSNWYLAKHRNEAGVEEYSNFFSMLLHKGLAMVIGIVGAVMAISAIAMLLFS